jgi:hypothetical protein
VSSTGGDAGSVSDVIAADNPVCEAGPGSGKRKELMAMGGIGARGDEARSLAGLRSKNASRR